MDTKINPSKNQQKTFHLLGPRLQTVASFVPPMARLGDIGTDHAYLPVALFEQGKITKAIAVDVHKGPYETAKAAVEARSLTHVIDVRFGDGLKPINPGEVDTLTFAGMGGRTILDILAARPEVVDDVSEVIVQPQGLEAGVRQAFLNGGWLIKQECLVEEEGRIYVVMAYSKREGKGLAEILERQERWRERALNHIRKDQAALAGKKQGLNESEVLNDSYWHLGPLILENPNTLFKRLVETNITELQKRIEEMKKAKSQEVQKRRQEVALEKNILVRLSELLFD